jgi:hypothetical protein
MPNLNARERFDVIGDLVTMSRWRGGIPFEPIAFATSEIERGNPFVLEVLSAGVEI